TKRIRLLLRALYICFLVLLVLAPGNQSLIAISVSVVRKHWQRQQDFVLDDIRHIDQLLRKDQWIIVARNIASSLVGRYHTQSEIADNRLIDRIQAAFADYTRARFQVTLNHATILVVPPEVHFNTYLILVFAHHLNDAR